MRETQASIVAFADEAFGPAPSVARIAARANEEMAELLRAATMPDSDPRLVAREAADVVIILHRLAHVCGCDLGGEIDAKMAINRGRTWMRDGTGHGYHVRAK